MPEKGNEFDRNLDWLNRQNEVGYRRTDRYAAHLIDAIDEVENPPKSIEARRTPEKLKEEIQKDYVTLISMGESALLSEVNTLNRLAPIWPYNGRSEEFTLEGIRSEFEIGIASGEIRTERQKGPILRLAADLEQQEATQRILFSMGGAVTGYYDVLMQMNALTSRERYHATGEDYMSVLSGNDPGLTPDLTEEQSELLSGKLKEGFRKEIIAMQDEARMITLAVPAVGQWDFEANPGKETFMQLHPNQVEFVRLVFGEIDKNKWVNYQNAAGHVYKTPKGFTGWFHSSDSVESRRNYSARVMAVLEKSKEGSVWDTLPSMGEEQVRSLAQEIYERAEAMKADWKSPFKDVDRKITERVLGFWTNHDLAFMTSGRLAWSFEYAEVRRNDGTYFTRADGSRVVARKVEDGGIYKGWDSLNGRYWLRRRHVYQEGVKSASNFLSPDAQVIRRRFIKNKPGWTPPIGEYRQSDPTLDTVIKFLFDPAFENARKQFLAGEGASQEKINSQNGNIDPVVAKKLLKNMYAWVTPFLDENGKNLAFPMFFPAEIDIMDIWAYLRLDMDLSSASKSFSDEVRRKMVSALRNLVQERPDDFMVLQDNGTWIPLDPNNDSHLRKVQLSAFDLFTHGIRPSELDLTKMNYDTLDHYWVSMNMMFRFLKIMVDPNEGEKDPSIQAFFGDPSTQDERELSKRIQLAFRVVPKDMAWMVTALLPYAVVQQAANESGLFGPSVGNTTEVTAFVEKISKWVQAFKWLPQQMTEMEKDGEWLPGGFSQEKIGGSISNYGNDMALLAYGYMIQFLRIGQAAYPPNVLQDSQGTYDFLRKTVIGQGPLGNVLKSRALKQPTLDVALKQVKDAPLEKRIRK